MIQEITENLVTINDTISLAVSDLVLSNKSNNSSKALIDSWSVFGPILTGIIGAGIVLWSKNEEFKNIKENLDLQKELFIETKSNNENQIKAELIRLQDLSNQYKLSLKKFDFDKISMVLDLTKDKSEKIMMLKCFRKLMQRFGIDGSIGIGDFEGFEEFSTHTIYNNLDSIKNELNELRNQFPHIYMNSQDDLQKIVQYIEEVNHEAGEMQSLIANDEDDIISELQPSLLEIQRKLASVMDGMIEEFKIEERLKKDLISID